MIIKFFCVMTKRKAVDRIKNAADLSEKGG